MVGIFDSGLGGLTALSEFSKMMPDEDIVYFGDTGRVPYGSRSRETILKYSMQDMRFLLTHHVDAVLVACGTASSIALNALKAEYPSVPIIGVIEGAAEKAVSITKNGIVGIIATAATINSRSFVKAIERLSPEVQTVGVACPLFVPLVENDSVSKDAEATELIAQRHLKEIEASGADTLILGCTHYPIIAPIIQKILPDVTLINSSKEAAFKLSSVVTPKKSGGERIIKYYISDEPQNFTAVAEVFLGHGIGKDTTTIDIEKY